MPRIAFNIRPKRTPFGGANEFIKQFASHMAWESAEIVYHLDPSVTHVFIMDPRRIETCSFGLEDIGNFKKKFPNTQVILRVNNCDQKYGKVDYAHGAERLDSLFLQASENADDVVFISEWLRDYFIAKGFDRNRSHRVILNAANDLIYYPKNEIWDGLRPLRLVTHHWSDNWLKGFKEYQELDRLIAEGELENVEFTVIGRWPKEIAWRAARTLPPLTDMDLGNELRRHDVYFTASRWEPGGMHFIEGMQCGLPVVYHEDGGGIVELAGKAGVGFRDDINGAVKAIRRDYSDYVKKLKKNAPTGRSLCQSFADLVNK